MKKNIVIILILLSGCEEKNIKDNRIKYILSDDPTKVEIILIDNCEYLFRPNRGSSLLTHKGNCQNKIHQYKNI